MATTDPDDASQHPARADPAEPEPERRMLDKYGVAELLGGDTTATTVIRRYKHWGLTAYRVGRGLRWFESDVHEWIKNHRVN